MSYKLPITVSKLLTLGSLEKTRTSLGIC